MYKNKVTMFDRSKNKIDVEWNEKDNGRAYFYDFDLFVEMTDGHFHSPVNDNREYRFHSPNLFYPYAVLEERIYVEVWREMK